MTSVSDSFVGENIFSRLLTNLVLNRKEGAGLCLLAPRWPGKAKPLDLRHVPWKEFSDIDVIWSNIHVQSFDTSLQIEEFSFPAILVAHGSR